MELFDALASVLSTYTSCPHRFDSKANNDCAAQILHDFACKKLKDDYTCPGAMTPTIRSLLGTLPQAFLYRSMLRSILPDCQCHSLVAPVPPLHFIVNLSWERYMCSIAAYTLLSID